MGRPDRIVSAAGAAAAAAGRSAAYGTAAAASGGSAVYGTAAAVPGGSTAYRLRTAGITAAVCNKVGEYDSVQTGITGVTGVTCHMIPSKEKVVETFASTTVYAPVRRRVTARCRTESNPPSAPDGAAPVIPGDRAAHRPDRSRHPLPAAPVHPEDREPRVFPDFSASYHPAAIV